MIIETNGVTIEDGDILWWIGTGGTNPATYIASFYKGKTGALNRTWYCIESKTVGQDILVANHYIPDSMGARLATDAERELFLCKTAHLMVIR